LITSDKSSCPGSPSDLIKSTTSIKDGMPTFSLK
jgi:hypothetical protein